MIATTVLVVFLILRVFEESKALWISFGDFVIWLRFALDFLLQTLALCKFSFKSACRLTAVYILVVVHQHRTWRSLLGNNWLELRFCVGLLKATLFGIV